MTQKLSGKDYASELKTKLATLGKEWYREDRYVAILFFWDNIGSQVYTRLKKKFGNDISLDVRIIGQEKEYTAEEILVLIDGLNADMKCIGIIVQLPLPEYLESDKGRILTHIDHTKDIDGLWGEAFGKSLVLEKGFMPATPAAVVGLMDYHGLGNVKGKIVAVLGQSHLVGWPLATILMQRGASVISCNEHANQQTIKSMTKKADIIISCTGVVHLVDNTYVSDDKSQVLVDVGYGKKNGKAAGDVNPEAVTDFVKAYTPVPGGVWPATIAHLFTNIKILQDIRAV